MMGHEEKKLYGPVIFGYEYYLRFSFARLFRILKSSGFEDNPLRGRVKLVYKGA